jgi:2-oxoisovalerate dehydrogenase E1 component subunit alpha
MLSFVRNWCQRPSARSLSASASSLYEVASDLTIVEEQSEEGALPAFSVVNVDGTVRSEHWQKRIEALGKDAVVSMYKQMIELNQLDKIGYDVQRQGRISFYMTHFGEEATVIGAAHGLRTEDVVYSQYREAGVLLVRGWTMDDFMNQLHSNALDKGKGRQMPVHYGSAAHGFQTVSSPLTTQVPQAAGAAYALRQQGSEAIVACFFGEGAASEGDFHAGLNFASTLDCPVLFFCRNNGYAISTPTEDQYRGDGIAGRARGYGMRALRVDGNDMFAVLEATAVARRTIAETGRPLLLEAMSYRVGHHSTSDDSTRYREGAEMERWQTENNPIDRVRRLLERQEWIDEKSNAAMIKAARKDVLRALKLAERQPAPPIDELFTDVYEQLPPHLERQQDSLRRHLDTYGEHYDLNKFAQK